MTAEIPVSVEIKDSAELPKAETFTVTLRPVDGAPMPEDGTVGADGVDQLSSDARHVRYGIDAENGRF